ncbi:MAG: Gfo/Idh/MocA family oxidoreductase [Lachnospiraceae bacterium]|nr:Gfo/Idh/MocA family oxidoreductase [Lachnospiraceae bacterium]
MSNDKKLKVAVTGFENGHCFYLYQGLRSEPDVEIVAVSFAPRARIIYEKRLGEDAFKGVDIYYDEKEMFDAHPEIEACICGGSNRKHMHEFRLCAERGIHVISMKAPSYDMVEYDEMIRLAKENHIVVYIELEMRWKAAIERIREIIASGKLGEIKAFNAYNYSHNPMWWQHWMDIPEESYGKRIPIREGSRIFRGGALTDHPHIFDIIRYILDSDFDVVYAEAAPNMRDGAETEDLVYVIGKMKNGVIFSLDPSYANREPEQARIVGKNLSKYPRAVQVEMQVTGTKGTLYADSYNADCVEELEPGTQKYSVWTRDLALDNQRRIFVRNFISDIRNGTDNAAVSLEEHKRTLMASNAAYDSIYRGQPVKLCD